MCGIACFVFVSYDDVCKINKLGMLYTNIKTKNIEEKIKKQT